MHKNDTAVAVAPPAEPTGIPEPPNADPLGPDAAPSPDGPAAPTPTPKPACTAPDVAARTLAAHAPEKPEDAREQGLAGTAKVRVDLDAAGNVLNASVYESSGSMELDRAALDAARASSYAPEERNCKNIPGSYLFTVDFE